jgi:hypothetical protein
VNNLKKDIVKAIAGFGKKGINAYALAKDMKLDCKKVQYHLHQLCDEGVVLCNDGELPIYFLRPFFYTQSLAPSLHNLVSQIYCEMVEFKTDNENEELAANIAYFISLLIED